MTTDVEAVMKSQTQITSFARNAISQSTSIFSTSEKNMVLFLEKRLIPGNLDT